jgi:hypothetical protein
VECGRQWGCVRGAGGESGIKKWRVEGTVKGRGCGRGPRPPTLQPSSAFSCELCSVFPCRAVRGASRVNFCGRAGGFDGYDELGCKRGATQARHARQQHCRCQPAVTRPGLGTRANSSLPPLGQRTNASASDQRSRTSQAP